jgi:hypothetical protein
MDTQERERREAEAKAMRAAGDDRWARVLAPVKASKAFREVSVSMEDYMVHLGMKDWERNTIHNAETEARVFAAAGVEHLLDLPRHERNGVPHLGDERAVRIRKAMATVEPAIRRRVARGEDPLNVIRSVLNAFTADTSRHQSGSAITGARRTGTLRSKADRTLDSSLATLDGVVLALTNLPVDQLGGHVRASSADQIHEAYNALRRLETRFREGDHHAQHDQ